MKNTKKQIENIFNVKVVGVVGNKRFLTIHIKEYPSRNIEGYDVIDTGLYTGYVDIINNKPEYTCTSCTLHRYYVGGEKKIEIVC